MDGVPIEMDAESSLTLLVSTYADKEIGEDMKSVGQFEAPEFARDLTRSLTDYFLAQPMTQRWLREVLYTFTYRIVMQVIGRRKAAAKRLQEQAQKAAAQPVGMAQPAGVLATVPAPQAAITTNRWKVQMVHVGKVYKAWWDVTGYDLLVIRDEAMAIVQPQLPIIAFVNRLIPGASDLSERLGERFSLADLDRTWESVLRKPLTLKPGIVPAARVA